MTAMREDWNARAKVNANYYVATCGKISSEMEYNVSGLFSAGVILDAAMPYMKRHNTMLDVGCGNGRVLQFTAPFFVLAHGVDVSDEYARACVGRVPSARIHVTDGKSVGPIVVGSVNLAYSTLVYNHIPDYETALELTSDVARVLSPDGVFVLHVSLSYIPTSIKHVGDTWRGFRWNKWHVDRMLKQAGLRKVKGRIKPGLKCADYLVVTRRG